MGWGRGAVAGVVGYPFVVQDGVGAVWCATSLRTDLLEVMNGYESSAVRIVGVFIVET